MAAVGKEDHSPFTKYGKTIQDGDMVIAYVNPLDLQAVKIVKDGTMNNKYGAFDHNSIIGKPFGTRVLSKKGNGHITFLHPTPELWTACLPHRTQILYMPDIALVSSLLDLKPGAVVIESGTGSGSFSHSIARTIAPTGTLHTFEYHEERVLKFKDELASHDLSSIIHVNHRNVCKDGFGLTGVSDAVFLDLPSPWEAVAAAKETFKKGKVGRICTFSPAIEQVQRTCEELEKFGFYDVRMFETLIRRQEIKTLQKKPLPTRDNVTGFTKRESPKRKRDGQDDEDEEAAEGGEKEDEEAATGDKADQVVVSRTVQNVAGHTSFLVFASIFIE
ncbi:tRNA methyltransferase complex GCD14 subunit [Rhizoclosmatium globosum]|uniref:tRNA (adenine(58)-N(1))-methyltransferase catalytic subunit TRM61 n=1 Tax=Rhizoclosmatium globosum TaxID=329046 RepID=A0A1Y2CPZ8_9FUNG|nr:tRNA methyltransferase complex GCD14 subunit [Rhizoclosmatium globosum]|eukprot:ORY48914.1 tRNA methyltransferase complex GCD14 subunit [Rhizoclosmatium globosum]